MYHSLATELPSYKAMDGFFGHELEIKYEPKGPYAWEEEQHVFWESKRICPSSALSRFELHIVMCLNARPTGSDSSGVVSLLE